MCLAIPGRVVAITTDDGFVREGRVSFGGAVKLVNLSFAPEAAVDDYVIVHAGFAITVLDRDAAERSLAELRNLDADAFDALGQDAGAEPQ